MKKLLKSILFLIKNAILFLKYILRLVWNRAFTNPIKEDCSGAVALLANGPSLKDVITRLQTNEFENTDLIVLNYFACEEVFWKVKPIHYCLADPMFFQDTHRKDEAQKLFALLQKVHWTLNLYLPKTVIKKFLLFSKVNNPNINIIAVNSVGYEGFSGLRHFFYKHGLAIPCIQTVTILAIYIALNRGYSTIRLYGVEHSFLDSLCVNEKNELCSYYRHFYDKGEVMLKPIVRIDNSKVHKVADYLDCITRMFKSHDLLSNYANYLGTKIINCTKNSMIDSYERKI